MVGGRGDITIGKLREQPPFWALFNTIPWPTSYCAPEQPPYWLCLIQSPGPPLIVHPSSQSASRKISASADGKQRMILRTESASALKRRELCSPSLPSRCASCTCSRSGRLSRNSSSLSPRHNAWLSPTSCNTFTFSLSTFLKASPLSPCK